VTKRRSIARIAVEGDHPCRAARRVHQPERPGARRLPARIRAAGNDHPAMVVGEQAERAGHRLPQGHADRHGVHQLHRADGGVVAGEGAALRVGGATQREDDVLGLQRIAVVEADIRAQAEGEDATVG
jgi:hypothetical protein